MHRNVVIWNGFTVCFIKKNTVIPIAYLINDFIVLLKIATDLCIVGAIANEKIFNF